MNQITVLLLLLLILPINMYLFKVVTILESTVQTIRTLAKWDLSCGASELSDPIYSIQYDESFPFSSTIIG